MLLRLSSLAEAAGLASLLVLLGDTAVSTSSLAHSVRMWAVIFYFMFLELTVLWSVGVELSPSAGQCGI